MTHQERAPAARQAETGVAAVVDAVRRAVGKTFRERVHERRRVVGKGRGLFGVEARDHHLRAQGLGITQDQYVYTASSTGIGSNLIDARFREGGAKRYRERLADAGCDFGQGYLFSPPLPEDAFFAYLAAQTR